MPESAAVSLLLEAGLKAAGKRIAWVNASFHPMLRKLEQSSEEMVLVQTFKPMMNALNQTGFITGDLSGVFDVILLIPSKDKVQSLGWIAEAFNHLAEKGILWVACENQHGAKSYESALKSLAGRVASSSKSKCRVFSARKTDAVDGALQQSWLNGAMPRTVESHGLWAQAGLFSWKSADTGSLLLLENLPELTGEGMDLCAGYGLLTAAVLKTSPEVTRVHLVEAEGLALGCVEKSLCNDAHKIVLHHLDAAVEKLPDKLDWVICNPPFHTGQSRDVGLGKQIVERACESLKKGGELYLVANRQLPYENIIKAKMQEMEIMAVGNGFKVLYGKR